MKTFEISELELYKEAGRVPKMRERGVRVRIENQLGTTTILDGRYRFLAAKEIGLDDVPAIDSPIIGDEPVVYLLRMASKRRNLSDDHRVMLANKETEWPAKCNRQNQAKEAGRKGAEFGKCERAERCIPQVQESSDKPKESKARKEAANAHNVKAA